VTSTGDAESFAQLHDHTASAAYGLVLRATKTVLPKHPTHCRWDQ
jgi:hypothetical protein